jgi:hypothetical protein
MRIEQLTDSQHCHIALMLLLAAWIVSGCGRTQPSDGIPL